MTSDEAIEYVYLNAGIEETSLSPTAEEYAYINVGVIPEPIANDATEYIHLYVTKQLLDPTVTGAQHYMFENIGIASTEPVLGTHYLFENIGIASTEPVLGTHYMFENDIDSLSGYWGKKYISSSAYGPPLSESVPIYTDSGSQYTGQLCTITNRFVTLRVIRVDWYGVAQAGDYEIIINGVNYGVFTLGYHESPAIDVSIDLNASDTFTFNAYSTAGDRQYAYNNNDPYVTSNFSFGYWVNASGGETVPLTLTFQEQL